MSTRSRPHHIHTAQPPPVAQHESHVACVRKSASICGVTIVCKDTLSWVTRSKRLHPLWNQVNTNPWCSTDVNLPATLYAENQLGIERISYQMNEEGFPFRDRNGVPRPMNGDDIRRIVGATR